jgi:hypothetical protein
VRAAGAVALAAFSVAFGVAVNGSRAPGAGAAAAAHGSYCQAALAVALYQGHERAHLDAAHLDMLIGHALARAQGARGSVKSLRLMRSTAPSTPAYTAARRAFTKYNTDHCCECHPSSEPPQMMSTPPPSGT